MRGGASGWRCFFYLFELLFSPEHEITKNAIALVTHLLWKKMETLPRQVNQKQRLPRRRELLIYSPVEERCCDDFL